jgi:hypothetical protein
MTAEAIFQIANTFAALSWVALLLLARQPIVTRLIIPIGACGLLSLAYLYLVVNTLGESDGGFGSLSDVSLLFQNQSALLAGWIHYLAFDLFIGCWEVRDARRHDISIVLIVPALILTFLFGPVGLLAYLLIRFVRTRSVIIDDHQNL